MHLAGREQSPPSRSLTCFAGTCRRLRGVGRRLKNTTGLPILDHPALIGLLFPGEPVECTVKRKLPLASGMLLPPKTLRAKSAIEDHA